MVTVILAVYASGYTLAPMLIFLGVQYRDHFVRQTTLGTVGKEPNLAGPEKKLLLIFFAIISGIKLLLFASQNTGHCGCP